MACEVSEVNIAMCRQDLYIICYMLTFEKEISEKLMSFMQRMISVVFYGNSASKQVHFWSVVFGGQINADLLK